MENKIKRCALTALACLLVLGLTAGCATTTDRSERPGPDWSRGLRVGQTTINSRVGLATDATGDNTYLVWIARQDETDVLRFARIDRAGEVVTQGDLAIAADLPNMVELTLDTQGGLHLAWTARAAGQYRLFYARIDANGDVTAAPAPVSLPEVMATRFSLNTSPTGESDLFWIASVGNAHRLYHLRLDTVGQVLADNKLLQDGVIDAMARRDRNGVLRLAWMQESAVGNYQIQYARFDEAARALVAAVQVGDAPGGTGLVQRGPDLGLAGDDAYVLWSVERRGGGLVAASAETYYSVFPLDQPELAGKPRQLLIPGFNPSEYAPVESLGQTRQLASMADQWSVGRFVYLPATPQTHQDELAVSVAVQLQGRTREAVQIALVFWSAGEIKGYQVAGKTASSSLKSALAVDGQNNLHLAWIDTAGFGRYDLFYASTAPEARAHLNRLLFADVVAFVLSLAWVFASSLAFFPLAFMWIAVPLAAISIYLFIRAEGDLERRSSRAMLGVAALIYLALKYLTESSWLALLQLPGIPLWLNNVLALLAPLLVAGLAGLITWAFIRKLEYKSLFRTFVVWAAWDTLLTLLLYMPILLIE